MTFMLIIKALWNSCKKENVGDLKRMLSNFCKTPVFILAID